MSLRLLPATLFAPVVDWGRFIASRRARPYLLVSVCMDAAFIFSFYVVIQSYLPEDGSRAAALPGYTLAAFGAAKLVAQLLGGRLVDRLGMGRGLLVGLGLTLAGQAALLVTGSHPGEMLGAAAVYGLGSAVLWPAVFALAAGEFAEEERARLMAAMSLTTAAALLVGIGLGFALPASFPYAAAMTVALGGVALGTLFALPLRPTLGPGAGSAAGHPAGTLRHVAQEAAEPRRMGLAIAMLMRAAGTGALAAVFRAYGRDLLGVSFREELLLLAPAVLMGGGAVVAGGILADRLGRFPLLASGFLASGVALWVLSSATSPGEVVPLAALGGFAFGLSMPSLGALSLDLSRVAGQGTLLAWFMTLEGLGSAAGPAAGAWLNSNIDTASVLRVAGTLFGLIALVSVVFVLPRQRPSAGSRRHVAGQGVA